jgi:hypothetical protein
MCVRRHRPQAAECSGGLGAGASVGWYSRHGHFPRRWRWQRLPLDALAEGQGPMPLATLTSPPLASVSACRAGPALAGGLPVPAALGAGWWLVVQASPPASATR